MTVDSLDVGATPPPCPTELFGRAIYTPAAERTAEMRAELAPSDDRCRRLLAADALLFAMPMHNWTVPAAFKAFIDQIVRAGLTFVAGPDGRPVGQLTRQKVLFLTTRGGDGRPGGPYDHLDALTPVLRAAFGFLGVAHPRFVDAQPLQFADAQSRTAALARAEDELDAVATAWATEPAPAA